MKNLILASTSVYRKRLLEKLEIPFVSHSPEVDEELLKIEFAGRTPADLALFLAQSKAQSLSKKFPNCWILGGDQVLCQDGKILGKPGTPEANEEQLRALSGKSHELITALAICKGERVLSHVDLTKIKVRTLTDRQIKNYVSLDQAWDCAGGYKIESRGLALVESLQTGDPSAIEGLPIIALVQMLKELNYEVFSE